MFNKKDIQEKTKVIINNKLFDFDRLEKVTELRLKIYKGEKEFYGIMDEGIVEVDENWLKELLGKYDVEKYIEVFGEPELA